MALSCRKLFLLVLIIGIIVRLFVAVALPDSAISDSVYHLRLAEDITETGFFPFGDPYYLGAIPPGIFHTFIASASIVSSLPIVLETGAIFSVIISIAQLLILVMLLKELFPKNWVYGAAFFTILPVITKYSGINTVETLASVFVLLSFYLLVRFYSTGRKSFLVLSVFSLAAMSASKLNATILLPAFLLFALFACRTKKLPVKKTALFLIAALLLSGAWFASDFMRTGEAVSSIGPDTEKASTYLEWGIGSLSVESVSEFWVSFTKGFWAFPSESALSRLDVLSVLPLVGSLSPRAWEFILLAVTVPLTAFLFYSIFFSVYRKKKYSVFLLSLFVLTFLVVLVRGKNFVYARLFLPAMPLLAISFTYGFESLRGNWRRVVTALVVVAACYSFFSMSFFAVYYNTAFQNNSGLYSEITGLPQGSRVIISGNHVRVVKWLSGLDSLGPEEAFRVQKTEEPLEIVSSKSAEEIYSKLKELEVTHLALTCADDPWNVATISEMEQGGLLESFFEEGCAKLFVVK